MLESKENVISAADTLSEAYTPHSIPEHPPEGEAAVIVFVTVS